MNAETHGYTLGMNKYGDLTTKEFAAMLNGYKMSQEFSSADSVFESTPNASVKDSVDWRQSGAVTAVKNQGSCGSCWAFATTGALEGQHYLKSGQLVSLSEQNLIDCSRNFGCNGGFTETAFDYIIANGIDTEFSYPYQGVDGGTCMFSQSTVGATMTSYTVIAKGDVTGLTQALSSVGPIAVSMDASLKTFHLYSSGVYRDTHCSSVTLDHAVLAVGYGMNAATNAPYFLVKNSWGSDWGMEGYFMIARDSSNMCGLATNAVYPVV